MSIAVNQNVLSSEIIDYLKSVSEKPLRYLNGYEFTNSANLPYYNNWNAAATELFNNGNFSPNAQQKNSLFAVVSTKQTEFIHADLGIGTPKVFANSLLNNPLPNVPVASFDDISSFVANAFIPFSNIRYSSFMLLKNVPGKSGIYIRNTFYGNALLTKNAIEAKNGQVSVLNNVSEASLQIGEIDSLDKFLDNSGITEELSELRTNTVNAEMYTSILSSVVKICLSGVNNIRKNLSCQFGEISIDNSKVKIFYHNTKNQTHIDVNSKEDFTVDSYTAQQVKNYSTVFPDADQLYKDIFVGWTTNANNIDTRNPEYKAGNTLYVQNIDVHLYAVFQPPYTITYDFSNFGFTDKHIANRQFTSYGTHTVLAFNSNNFTVSKGSITSSKYKISAKYWANLTAPFLFWSTNPNCSPYNETTKNITVRDGNKVVEFSNVLEYKTANGSSTFDAGTVINLTKNLTLYPVFKTITVDTKTDDGDYSSDRETLRRYINYPYGQEYYYIASRAANIGLNSHFMPADFWRLMNSVTDNGKTYEATAERTLAHASNYNHSQNTVSNFRSLINGYEINDCVTKHYIYNDDGKNVRPLIVEIGVMEWWDDTYGHYFLTDVYKNQTNVVSWSNNSNLQKNLKAVGPFYFGYKENNKLVKKESWLPRFFTDWVDPRCPIHFKHSITMLDISMRFSPSAGVFRTFGNNIKTYPNHERTTLEKP